MSSTGGKRTKLVPDDSSAPQWTTSSGAIKFGTGSDADVPSWLKPKDSASVPSWLTKAASSTATFGSSTFGSSSATFSALANGGAVFGTSKKESEEESAGEEEEEEGEEEGENEDAVFGNATSRTNAALVEVRDTVTGEEGEKQLIQISAKLYRLGKKDAGMSWQEVGSGPIRVNVPAGQTPVSNMARIVMRRQGVMSLLLNAPITVGFVVDHVQDKMVRFSCESYTGQGGEGQKELGSFLVKCAREDERDSLVAAIAKATPTGAKRKPQLPSIVKTTEDE